MEIHTIIEITNNQPNKIFRTFIHCVIMKGIKTSIFTAFIIIIYTNQVLGIYGSGVQMDRTCT